MPTQANDIARAQERLNRAKMRRAQLTARLDRLETVMTAPTAVPTPEEAAQRIGMTTVPQAPKHPYVQLWESRESPEGMESGAPGMLRNTARAAVNIGTSTGQMVGDLGKAALTGVVAPWLGASRGFEDQIKVLKSVGEMFNATVEDLMGAARSVGLDPTAGGLNPIVDLVQGRSWDEIKTDYPQYAEAIDRLHQNPLGPALAAAGVVEPLMRLRKPTVGAAALKEGMPESVIQRMDDQNLRDDVKAARAEPAPPPNVPSRANTDVGPGGPVKLLPAPANMGDGFVTSRTPSPVERLIKANESPTVDQGATAYPSGKVTFTGPLEDGPGGVRIVPPELRTPTAADIVASGGKRVDEPRFVGKGGVSPEDFREPEYRPSESQPLKLDAEGNVDLFEQPWAETPKSDVRRAMADAPENADPFNRPVELHGGFGAVGPVFEWIKDNLPDAVKQARNRGKTGAFKLLVRKIENQADAIWHNYAGDFIERLRKAGLSKKADGPMIADAMEAGTPDAAPYRQIMNEMFDIAKQAGVDVTGYVKNYFPRMMKSEIGQIIWDDTKAAIAKMKELETLGFADEASMGVISKKIEQQIGAGSFKNETAMALQHLIKTGQAKNYAEAFYKLKQRAFEDVFRPFGNIEKHRTMDLPQEFYERDARKILPRYVMSWAKRVAEVETFGKHGQGATDLLKRIDEVDPQEAVIARQILDAWSGNFDAKAGLSPKWQRVMKKVSEVEVGTKIGLGWGALKNTTQVLISTATTAGWKRTLTGIAKLADPERRSAIRKSGATLQTALEAMAGYEPTGKTGQFSKAATKWSGFKGINKANQYMAASTAMELVPDLHRLANKGGIRQKWAQAKLSEMDIDHTKPLTQEAIDRATYRFATDTQLQKNVLSDPLAFNDPKYRSWFLFKRFGYRQAAFVKDHVIGEMQRTGNAMPLLRLVAGGVIGGEMTLWAQSQIKELLSGEKEPERAKIDPSRLDKDMLDRAIEDVAAVGGLGIAMDVGKIFERTGSQPPNLKERAMFLATPVQIADAIAIVEGGLKAWWESDEYDIEDVLQRSLKSFRRLLGGLPAQALRRAETPDQKKNKMESDYGDMRNQVFEAYAQDKPKRANDIIRDWSKRYPGKRPEVSGAEYRAWLKRQQEKRLNP